MRQRDEVFANLNSEQIISTLEACSLEDKQEFTEDEFARIEYCRSLVEQQGKTYKQAAAQFRKQDKLKQTGDTQPNDNTLEMLELLALAGEQVGGKISITEAFKILPACDLPDKAEYTSGECDRFVEACVLVKQGKTYEDVREHFGVANGDNQQQRQEIIGEIQDMMGQATAMISAAQAEKIQQTISKMTLVQLKEIRAQIEQQTALRLQEYIDSGRMERELQAAADLVINEPFLTWSPALPRALNGDRDRKSLPGS